MSSSGSAFTWMGSMARSTLCSLGPIRLLSNLEACALRDLIWVRGGAVDKPEQDMLNALPWNDRYEIISGKYLRPLHALLPVGRVPTHTWIPLATFIEPILGQTLLPGIRPASALFHWIPAVSERRPKFLLARGTEFQAFADRSSQIRLTHLKFAQAKQDMLIAGRPLPSLPGTYFYEEDGIAWPAGYHIQPRLSRTTWARLLQVRETDLALVHLDGSYSVIHESAWVEASRSAVRLSCNTQAYV